MAQQRAISSRLHRRIERKNPGIAEGRNQALTPQNKNIKFWNEYRNRRIMQKHNFRPLCMLYSGSLWNQLPYFGSSKRYSTITDNNYPTQYIAGETFLYSDKITNTVWKYEGRRALYWITKKNSIYSYSSLYILQSQLHRNYFFIRIYLGVA